MNDFDYLSTGDIYLDSACQSLRPRPVIEALEDYYTKFNSCGERVKYQWGRITDQKVESTREKVLKYLKLKPRHYFVSFTLNTTYGLNLLLSQFDSEKAGIEHIITSDIEHNSPFLSTMSFARKNNIERIVIDRNPDGSININDIPEKSLVVVNAASNIDGRRLENIKDVIKKVHKTGGFIIIDAAQAMAHSKDILEKTDPDAICFSAHKMYAPSLGGMIIRKDFLEYIDSSFIGGGMVDDVDRESYLLSAENPDHISTKFEAGLQAWGEIIALGAAIDWLEALPSEAHKTLEESYTRLYEGLDSKEKVHLIGSRPNPTMSFYVDGLDSHLLGSSLADEGVMTRTGYFCVHYYLDHKLHLPPLVRFSLGYHNRPEDIDKVLEILYNI